MLIQVAYPDNRFDYVKDFILDSLIEKRAIARFRRSSGWVTLGMDPIRASKRDFTYKAPSEVTKIAFSR